MVSEPISRALGVMGYENPTPIQEDAIPVLFNGKDLVGKAQTGTGKTAAFGIPIVEKLDPTSRDVQAIILVPTRELAVQVTGELRQLARFRGLKCVTLYGGEPIIRQLEALEKGVQIVVGTPGRVLDHINRGTVRLDRVRIAILDEADQMLDIGFAEDMVRILRLTPRERQTALFSATLAPFIRRMINRFLNRPVWIQMGEEIEPASTIRQLYYEVALQDKFAGLKEVLKTELRDEKALVFCRTQIQVDRLSDRLKRDGFDAEPIHGGLHQSQRDAVMNGFRSGRLRILIATNVAARGLDIPEISHVINYDMPGNVEEYVHRVGRTGRIGTEGTAITFAGEGDFEMIDSLKKHLGDDLRKGRLSLYDR